MSDDEFSIIETYFAHLGFQSANTVIGPGDDCAVTSVPSGFDLCTSIDTLVSGVHFPQHADGALVAARAFGASVSDLAAMGAAPYAMTGALTFPAVDHAWLKAFADTWSALSKKYQMPLVGGNLSQGPLSVTVNVMGLVPSGGALTRSGAQVGDVVFVTGHPGNAGGGLALLGKAAPPDLANAYAAPQPRVQAGEAIRELAHSAIDISDGLLADAGHLAKASGVKISLQVDALPVSRSLIDAVGNARAQTLALTAGDDYELLFTAPASAVAAINLVSSALDLAMTSIGHVESGQGVQLEGDVPVDLDLTGYQHFRS